MAPKSSVDLAQFMGDVQQTFPDNPEAQLLAAYREGYSDGLNSIGPVYAPSIPERVQDIKGV